MNCLIIGNGNVVNGFNDKAEDNCWKNALGKLNYKYTIFDPHYRGSKNIENSFEQISSDGFDLIVIASPTEYHFQSLKNVIDFDCKYIILEKPMSNKLSDIDHMNNLIKNSKKKIIINYHRNFLSEFNVIQELNNVNDLLISAEFQGGIHNNLSHLLSLILNKITNIKTIKINYRNESTDFEVSSKGSKNVEISAVSVDRFGYSHWDATFFTSGKKIKILNGGEDIIYYQYKNGLKYHSLVKVDSFKTNINHSFYSNLKNKFYDSDYDIKKDILVSKICLQLEDKYDSSYK